jgi:hypothetical protein
MKYYVVKKTEEIKDESSYEYRIMKISKEQEEKFLAEYQSCVVVCGESIMECLLRIDDMNRRED